MSQSNQAGVRGWGGSWLIRRQEEAAGGSRQPFGRIWRDGPGAVRLEILPLPGILGTSLGGTGRLVFFCRKVGVHV
ncbi:hypothetical protein PV433_27455 [Paenibacillus sp. GYB004]|uniref:hypothetical protein n=1 Tax=Paenibacillus sp. GYB004 TaxID=2994393 RepID=UPI002F96383A